MALIPFIAQLAGCGLLLALVSCSSPAQWYKQGAKAKQIMIDQQVAYLMGLIHDPVHGVAGSGGGPGVQVTLYGPVADDAYVTRYMSHFGYTKTPKNKIPQEGRVPFVRGVSLTHEIYEAAETQVRSKGAREREFVRRLKSAPSLQVTVDPYSTLYRDLPP